MYRPLAPCPQCSRHLRTTERACPFCNADVTGVHGGRTLPEMARPDAPRGLSRAAVVMFGASLAVTACGSPPAPPAPDTPSDPVGDAPPDAPPDDDGGAVAEYGAPAPVDPPADETGDPPDDGGGMAPKYGGPSP